MTWFQKSLDTLALVYAILFFPVPIFWLLIHPAIDFWRRFGNRSFWIALPVWLISDIALILFRYRIFAERVGRSVPAAILGLLLVILGFWITQRVHGEMGLRRLAGLAEMNPGRYPEGIIRSGVYAYIRHPRYLGLMLPFVGLGLLTGSVGIFMLAIVTILLYQMIAPLEERELREHYGSQYEAYARTVPRFVPHLWRRTKNPVAF